MSMNMHPFISVRDDLEHFLFTFFFESAAYFQCDHVQPSCHGHDSYASHDAQISQQPWTLGIWRCNLGIYGMICTEMREQFLAD